MLKPKLTTIYTRDEYREEALGLIAHERERQSVKWGQQDHEDGRWALILGEEFGEACQAALDKPVEELEMELVHLGACVVAWLEAIQRRPCASE